MRLIDSIRKSWRRRRRRVTAPLWPRSLTFESSFACNLTCRMCPRSAQSFECARPDEVPIFQPDLFELLAPSLGRFEFVDLTGWGEPLINPHITSYVREIKARGPKVSFITNGILLDESRGEELLKTDLDMLSMSCDAGRAETYEAVRGRDQFHFLMENLARFRRMRDQMNKPTLINWAFVLMKSNIYELAEAVEWAGRCGIDRVSIKHMETAVDEENLSQALFDTGRTAPLSEKEQTHFEDMVHQARLIAGRYPRLQLLVTHPQFDPRERTCLARPNENVVMDHRGDLAPCCYTLAADTRPYQTERSNEEKTWVIGNLRERSMEEMIASARYRDFSRAFSGGAFPEVCRGCVQLARRPTQE